MRRKVVGYGVFAGKDFKEGDFIVRYGGYIDKEDNVPCRDYAVASGIETMILDATIYRNLGGFINHSDEFPNAEVTCIFDIGVEQTVVVATQDIPKGDQIFIDYSQNYFDEKQKLTFVNMSGLEGFPSRLPKEVFASK